MALIEIDDFPSELNLHFFEWCSMAMLNNQMVTVGILLVITGGYIFDISPYVSVYHYEIP